MLIHKEMSQGALRVGAAAALVTLLACTASVEVGGTPTQTKALADRIPSGVNAVGWIDVQGLKDAMPPEDWASYEQMLEEDEDYQDLERFVAATGIDPRTDIRQVALAAFPDQEDETAPLFLISVSMDRSRLESTLAGVETIDYQGRALYPMRETVEALEEAIRTEGEEPGESGWEIDADEKPGFLVILDDETLAFGVEHTIQATIDVDDGNADALRSDAAMNDLIADVADAGQIWFVANKQSWQSRMDDLQAAPVQPGAVESIQTVTMSLRLGDGLSFRLSGITDSADNAKLLADSLTGIVSMGKMMLQQDDPETFAILDRGIRISSDEQALRIEAELTAADVETLRGMAEKRAAGGS